MTPAWLLDAVAAVMLAVALISAARLAAARLSAAPSWRRGVVASDTDVAHLLMAVAMAGMLAPGLHTLPDAAWAVILGLLAAWFAVRVARDARANGVRALAGGHCAPHLVHSCSMVYMFLAMTATAGAGATSGMGGMAGAAGSATMSLRYPTLALAFAFILVGYSVWDLDQLSGRRYSLGAPRLSLAGIATPGLPAPGLPAPGLPVPGLPMPGLPVLAGTELGSAALPGPVPLRDHAAGESGFLLSPAVTIGCRIAMGVAMAFMLFIAI